MSETPAMIPDSPRYAFLPGGEPAAMLTGHILPPDADDSDTVVRISQEIGHEYEEDERAVLELLAPLQPWTAAVAVMESIGGNERALEVMSEMGTLLRLPGTISREEFSSVFAGLKLITLNDAAVHGPVNGISANLVCGDAGLTVSSRVWELLLLSRLRAGKAPWNKDLPATLDQDAGGDQALLERMIGEVVPVLAPMINNKIAALIRID